MNVWVLHYPLCVLGVEGIHTSSQPHLPPMVVSHLKCHLVNPEQGFPSISLDSRYGISLKNHPFLLLLVY